MSKMFNIENCDVTMENGYLRLVYHTDELLMPMTLAIGKTYHDLNEKSMYLFGQEDWAKNVVEWSIRKESPIWHNLLADIYKNHHDLYSSIMVTPEDYNEDYLILEATGEIDENTGHHMARFDRVGLNGMDMENLVHLAEDLDVCVASMTHDELVDALANVDIDIDECEHDCDNCDFAEKTAENNVICHMPDDDDDDDECDGDCENCDYADCDDENDEDTQPDVQPYEYVDGPAHYHGTECIENMRKLYGDEAVRWFCICNAYKYRFRNGSKPGVSAEQDREKADWYENYAANMMGEQRYY